MRDHVLLHVNGIRHEISGEQLFETLARYLRETKRATGTKIVCEEGDCGACTVLVGRVEDARFAYRPVNSCIQFLFQLDGTHVVTVEGLGTNQLTPVQDEMIRCHGAQCGYCTPGFIMAMAGLYEHCERPEAADVRDAITGNLCRCTGYEPIVNAGVAAHDQPRIDTLFAPQPMLDAIAAVAGDPIATNEFARPVTLAGAVEFKSRRPDAVIVQGATDYGVWNTKRGYRAPAILSLDGIEELRTISIDEARDEAAISRESAPSPLRGEGWGEGRNSPKSPPSPLRGEGWGEGRRSRTITFGARVTLADFERTMRDLVPALAPIMDRFGSPQIKNAGTLAGNIANASPIGDSLPFLFVAGAALELASEQGTRTVPIRNFYLGYKKLDLRPDELITRIAIPLPSEGELLKLYKVSKRSHLDISSFTAAVAIRRSGERIDDARVAFGGVGPVVLRLAKTESFLNGRPYTIETFAQAGAIARDEIAPIGDVRGSREYRLQLAENILCRFFHETSGTPDAAHAEPR